MAAGEQAAGGRVLVPISLTGAITLAAPAAAELQCQSTGIGNVIYPSITAIEAGTLHQAP